MKKEEIQVPRIDTDLRKEAINEALDRGIKKVIIFWDKNDQVHYPRYIENNENVDNIINNASPVDVYVETVDIEQSVKHYALLNEDGINYNKAWFKIEFSDEKVEEVIKAFVPS
jgi:hypothetical protein